MENKLQVLVDKCNVTQEAGNQLIKAFGAPFTEVGEILADYRRDDRGELIVTDKTIVVTDEDDTAAMKKAREVRLELKKVRTTVENKRKELKEDSLRTGKAIDGVAKYIKDNIQPVEEYLETQERFAEMKAAARAAELKQARIMKLQPICENPYVYSLDTMSDVDFEKLYAELHAAHTLKLEQAAAYEREQERIRAEKEAEDIRIREENELLRQQAAALEAEIAKEREEQVVVQQAEIAAVRTEAEQKLLDGVNALRRFVAAGVNDDEPMIDYESVVKLINHDV
jgi:hypothetical protein